MRHEAIWAKYLIVAQEPTDMIEHMATIADFASECPRIVEMGVYDCTSTWALLAGEPAWMRSYDTLRQPEVTEAEEITKACGVDFQFVLASSLTVEIEETDLLFIDTLHTYAQLKEELRLHADKARKYILLHDTTTFGDVDQHGDAPGLWLAVEEFLATHPSIWGVKERFTNCHGLTVLERL